jgi:L-lactate dehydrogenase complex protein LldG
MSKSSILQQIRQNKPEDRPLPEVLPPPWEQADLRQAFWQQSESLGSTVRAIDDEAALADLIAGQFAEAKVLVSAVPGLPVSLDLHEVAAPLDLQAVDVAVLRGQFGVAENGAIWLTERECVHRVLPFITQHLVLVIDRKAMVPTMHQAYAQIQIDETGFGVFIAGPSKTADIEQSLVIGAQGARSLTVVLVGPDPQKAPPIAQP